MRKWLRRWSTSSSPDDIGQKCRHAQFYWLAFHQSRFNLCQRWAGPPPPRVAHVLATRGANTLAPPAFPLPPPPPHRCQSSPPESHWASDDDGSKAFYMVAPHLRHGRGGERQAIPARRRWIQRCLRRIFAFNGTTYVSRYACFLFFR